MVLASPSNVHSEYYVSFAPLINPEKLAIFPRYNVTTSQSSWQTDGQIEARTNPNLHHYLLPCSALAQIYICMYIFIPKYRNLCIKFVSVGGMVQPYQFYIHIRELYAGNILSSGRNAQIADRIMMECCWEFVIISWML